MKYYQLEPEVAGEFGINTVINNSVHPPVVKVLHYHFNGWLGDDLLETFPCYVISDRLRELIQGKNFTGYSLSKVEISTSEQFKELYPDRLIPTFWWLKITGRVKVDDWAINEKHCLVVSNQVYNFLKNNNAIEHCNVKVL